jgi:hypothetical protein
MTDEGDPPRIGEPGGPGAPRLGELLKSARSDVGTDAEVGALRAALAPALGPAGAAKAGASTAVKVGVGAALVVGAAALWLATQGEPAPAPRKTTTTMVASAVAPEAPPPAPAKEEPPAPVESAAPATSSSGAEPRPSRFSMLKPATSEAELLGRAQAAVASNPALSLQLCHEHKASFPHGMMVQEREVIAIEALVRAGRREAAAARAERFRKAFPSSAYTSKVDGLVPR